MSPAGVYVGKVPVQKYKMAHVTLLLPPIACSLLLGRYARHMKPLGRLPLAEALGCESAILRKEVSAFDAISTLVAIIVASMRILDSRSHSYLLFPSFAFVFVMAKDGEVAFSFQPCIGSSL